MKRVLIALAILVCMAGTCIALDYASVSGTYISKKDGKEYLRLQSDSTFLLRQRKVPPSIDDPFEELAGKYTIQAEKIILNLSNGGQASGTIKDNTFEDAQGTQWVKEGSEQPQMMNVPHQPQHRPHSF